jgi:hypothetical protein
MGTFHGNIFVTFVILIALFVARIGVAGERYSGPMIDAHGHLGASFDWDTIVDVMDRNNVTSQILMARYYPALAGYDDEPGNDKLALQLARTYPGRFFPLVGMQKPSLTGAHKWHNPDNVVQGILRRTEKKLATGQFYGIGEVIVRHFAYSSGRHAEIENPIYSSFMHRLSELASRYNVPIIFHMEGEPKLVEDLSRLLNDYPRSHYVWAHNCGRSHADVIKSMLTNHPNLFCDLASMTNVGRTGYGIGWPRMEAYTALIEEDGELFPSMLEVYESFPDRFMIGMDVAHAHGMNHRNYARRSNRFRELLGQLKPQTAAAIAERNAIKIFKLTK